MTHVCEGQLRQGQHVLIVDAGYTKRWDAPFVQSLLDTQNSLTREFCTLTEAHGDVGWITDSSYINNSIDERAAQQNVKYRCPKSIDDIGELEFLHVLDRSMMDCALDDATFHAFPAEMAEEVAADQPTLDAVYGEEDEAFFPVGEPLPEELAEQQLLDEMPLPGFPLSLIHI